MKRLIPVVILGLLSSGLSTSADAMQQAPLTSWEPSTVSVTAIQGSTVTRVVELHGGSGLVDVAAAVRGGLGGRLRITEVPAPLADGTNQIVLSLSARVDDSVGEAFTGVVLLTSGNRVASTPLKVRLEVVAPPDPDSVRGFVTASPDLLSQDEGAPPYVEGELLLFPASGVSASELAGVVEPHGGTVVGRGLFADLYQVRFEGLTDSSSLAALVLALESQPEVDSAGLNRLFTVNYAPNDPRHHLPGAWGVNALGLPAVWNPTGPFAQTGDPTVTVGVVDTDFDASHEDLKANATLELRRSFENPHGTNTSSVIGAVGNNGTGMTGVMWAVDLRLHEAQYQDDNPWTFWIDESRSLSNDLVCDSMYRLARDGAEVISYSAGAWYEDSGKLAADTRWWGKCIDRARTVAAVEGGALDGPLFVFSAGNDGRNASRHLPSALADDPVHGAVVMSIGAHDLPPELALSDWGLEATNYGSSVSVLAPGTDVNCAEPGDAYTTCSGTSLAAPLVSGLAGLVESQTRRVCEVDPSARDVKQMILNGSVAYGRSIIDPSGTELRYAHAPESLHEADMYCDNTVERSMKAGTRVGVLGHLPPFAIGEGQSFHVRHYLVFSNHCLGPEPAHLRNPGIRWYLWIGDGLEVGEPDTLVTSQPEIGCYPQTGVGEDGYPIPGMRNGALWQFPNSALTSPLTGEKTLTMRVEIPPDMPGAGTYTFTRDILFVP